MLKAIPIFALFVFAPLGDVGGPVITGDSDFQHCNPRIQRC